MDRTTRFDPATLAVGALVLFAFHADIQLTHTPDHRWTFQFHTKPISDSTIGPNSSANSWSSTSTPHPSTTKPSSHAE